MIPGRILVGAYPSSLDDVLNAEILKSILQLGITTFVCLQQGDCCGPLVAVLVDATAASFISVAVAVAGCSCWLQLLAAVAGCGYWLLLLAAVAGCGCWLLLLAAVAGCGCSFPYSSVMLFARPSPAQCRCM